MYSMPLIKQEDIDKKINKRNIWRNLLILVGLLVLIILILKKQYLLTIIPVAWIVIVILYINRVNNIYKTKIDNYLNIYQNGRLVKNCPIVYELPEEKITFFTPHIQYKKKDGTVEYLDCGGFKCLNGCVAEIISIYSEPKGETNDIVVDEATGYYYYDTCIDRTSGNREEDFLKLAKEEQE